MVQLYLKEKFHVLIALVILCSGGLIFFKTLLCCAVKVYSFFNFDVRKNELRIKGTFYIRGIFFLGFTNALLSKILSYFIENNTQYNIFFSMSVFEVETDAPEQTSFSLLKYDKPTRLESIRWKHWEFFLSNEVNFL